MPGDDNFQLRLPALLDLAASEALLDTMRRASEAATVTVDASSVDVLTLPCMQIILSALRSHRAMTIENPSEAFVGAFADLALEWRPSGQPETHPAPKPDTPPVAQATLQREVPPDGQSEVGVNTQPASQQEPLPDGQSQAQPDAQTGARMEMPAAAITDRAENEILAPPDTKTDEACMAKRILTIDDSKTIRDMLNLTLSEAGYEVLTAVDGQDGIDMLGKERVDLVITDINMPKMDGYAVVRHMRSKEELKKTPVLVLTTESDAEKRNIAREAGATGWMVKPFDPERLIATINKVAP